MMAVLQMALQKEGAAHRGFSAVLGWDWATERYKQHSLLQLQVHDTVFLCRLQESGLRK